MKSIQFQKFGGPEVLQLVDGPDLQAGAGEVVVQIHAIGVNPVDTYIRSGIYGERPLPFTPGSDAAGLIVKLGAGVEGWKVGDRVYLAGAKTGTYAEQAVCSLDQIYALPESVDFPSGAALYVPYSTAYRALFQRGGAQPGEWVLVHGASGGVGLAATQWGRAHGLRIIGTAGSEAGLKAVLEAGAEHAMAHDEVAAKLPGLTGGRGPALILEMLANANLQKDLDMVAKFGRIVVIGNRGTLGFNPRGTMLKEADIRGMSLFNTPPEDLRSIQTAIGAGLRAGSLKPVIAQKFALAEASKAHEAILKPGSLGKIVLIP